MRLIKLIGPATLVATLALFAPYAGAQTMGEYATTTAGVGTGAGSMGTSIGSSVSNTTGDIGGSSTWSASSLGAGFDERASAAGSGLGGDFESRAASSASASGSESRWPTSALASGTERFSENSDRFKDQDQDRFRARTDLSSSDRFPPSAFDQNREGLDTHYSSSSGLDNHFGTSGEDNSYNSK
jgi:hypothetical protein